MDIYYTDIILEYTGQNSGSTTTAGKSVNAIFDTMTKTNILVHILFVFSTFVNIAGNLEWIFESILCTYWTKKAT